MSPDSRSDPIGAWYTSRYVGRGDGSYDSLNSVGCTVSFGVVGNAHGRVYVNQPPRGGEWTVGPGVRAGYDISTVSCTPDGLCVLSGPHETSSAKAIDIVYGGSSTSTWTTHWNADPFGYPQPTAVSCASDTLCVGVSSARIGIGYAIISTHPRYPGSFTGDTARRKPNSLRHRRPTLL